MHASHRLVLASPTAHLPSIGTISLEDTPVTVGALRKMQTLLGGIMLPSHDEQTRTQVKVE